ncbi:MAG TPA: hypothetical protein VN063_02595 [Methylophilaceae bacterium]|nr:hypothetical protein [Methylophilaceae bacterium]
MAPVAHDDVSKPIAGRTEKLEQLMDAVSSEIRNRLVKNISAYCDCV